MRDKQLLESAAASLKRPEMTPHDSTLPQHSSILVMILWQ